MVVAQGEPGNPDAIYAYDPLLVGDDGAVLLRPGKDGRLGEPSALEADLEPRRRSGRGADRAAGNDRRRRHALARPRHAPRRTRLPHERRGRRAARAAFPDADVLSYDLPHWNGRAEVMHLMSLISPLDDDLALVYPRLAPVRLLELLGERGIEVVEVPDEEFETMGPNVLALGPRRALALEGNDETRRRMEAAGVEGRHVPRRRDLPQGRRRPDLPDTAASPDIESRREREAPCRDRRRRRGGRAGARRCPSRARGARSEAGLSPVLQALYNGQPGLVDVLLAANPSLDVFDAAAVGRTRALEELLDPEPELARAWSPDGFTALHYAAFFGQEGAARSSSSTEREVGLVARNERIRVTPLHSAAPVRTPASSSCCSSTAPTRTRPRTEVTPAPLGRPQRRSRERRGAARRGRRPSAAERRGQDGPRARRRRRPRATPLGASDAVKP